MYKPVLFLCLLSCSCFGQDSTTHASGWLLKEGFSGKGNSVSGAGHFGFILGGEIVIGDRFSVSAGGAIEVNTSLNTAYSPFFLEGRYFLEKDNLDAFSDVLTSSDLLSGSYISVGLRYIKARPSGDFASASELSYFRNEEEQLLPNYGIDIKLGRQYWGLLDFGVLAGMDAATEKVSFDKNRDAFLLKRNNIIGVSSYFKFHFPFAGFKKRVFYKPNCEVIECATGYNQLVKFGLQDVFSFSNAGIYFRPEIAYERAIAKTGLSFNVSAELQFSRRKAYEIETYNYSTTVWSYSDSLINRVPIYSERPFLNQSIKFSVDPQLRWYFLQKRDLAKGKSIGLLEGFYISADASYATGSLEVFRDAWSFDRGCAFAFGGGVGYQKLLFQKVLMELGISMLYGNSLASPKKRELQRKGGVKFYWVK